MCQSQCVVPFLLFIGLELVFCTSRIGFCRLPYFVGSLGLPDLKILSILIGLNSAVDPLIYAFD